MDCDAFSVVITSNDLSPEKREHLANFLLLFGTSWSTGCSIPSTATGSKKKDSIFGCNGNKCQHLPRTLQEEEILVLDSPIKVALHKSCKQNLIKNLHDKGYYLSPAENPGLCFNPRAASNLPPYPVMVTSIIESCKVDLQLTDDNPTFIIHVADMGFRLPINNSHHTPTRIRMKTFFDQLDTMRDCGLSVELAQMDIAFVIPIPSGQLIQLSCERKNGWRRKINKYSIIDGCKMNIFPIHNLPPLNEHGLSQNEQKGTISFKRSDWVKDRKIEIGNLDGCEDKKDCEKVSEAVDLFQTEATGNGYGDEQLILHESDVHNVKHYSTFVHGLSQSRSKLPLQYKTMFGIGQQSITSLQKVLGLIDHKREELFKVLDTNGIRLRVEVSIRPHFDSPLRSKGHYNDILLHVCLALHDCYHGSKYSIKLYYIPARPVQTNTMIRISQALSHLKFRHSCQFCDIYKNDKVTEWFRSHLSILLITIGICPEFGLKYINCWLKDPQRYDPYGYSGKVDVLMPEKRDINFQKMFRSLDNFFCQLKQMSRTPPLTKQDTVKLKQYIEQFGKNQNACLLSTRDFYATLSLRAKLYMTTTLGQILSHMSQFLATIELPLETANENGNAQEPNKDENTTSNLLYHPNYDWWEQQNDETVKSSLEDLINKDNQPNNPILNAIYHLASIETFFNPSETLFAHTLCQHILQCHAEFKLPSLPIHITDTLQTCASGERSLSRDELKQLCQHRNIYITSTNFKKEIILQALSKHYSFPCTGVIFSEDHHTCGGIPVIFQTSRVAVLNNQHGQLIEQVRPGEIKHQRINKSINNAISHDFTFVIDHNKNRIIRNYDLTRIDITPQHKVALKNTSVQLIPKIKNENIYRVLAAICNTSEVQLRKTLHSKMSQLSKLQNSFLTSRGTTNPDFIGADNIADLESSKKFKLMFSTELCDITSSMSFPDVILPLTSIAYDRNFIFYDLKNSRTRLYVNHKLRLIQYEFQGVNLASRIKSSVISVRVNQKYNHQEYQWHEIAHHTFPSVPRPIIDHVNQLYNLDRMGGATLTCRNYQTILPNLHLKSRSSSDLFYESLSDLLHCLDPAYMENPGPPDILGVINFLEELSSNPVHFTGFGRTVKQMEPLFNLPLSSIIAHLNNTKYWPYTVICPIICLKYDLVIGIFENNNKIKKTHFYSVSMFSNAVECKHYNDYTKLTQRDEVIYFYTSKTTSGNQISGYYKPEANSEVKFDFSLNSKFSYLGRSNFKRVYNIFTDHHEIKQIDEQNHNTHDLRPETAMVVIHTHVKGTTCGTTLQEIIQMGLSHHALILIFPPCANDTSHWDSCIIHHPFQHEADALNTLKKIVPATKSESYAYYHIKGLIPTNCESGFYMMLYGFLGHKISNVNRLVEAINKLQAEDELGQKVRSWIHHTMNNRTNSDLPSWLEQVII